MGNTTFLSVIITTLYTLTASNWSSLDVSDSVDLSLAEVLQHKNRQNNANQEKSNRKLPKSRNSVNKIQAQNCQSDIMLYIKANIVM